MGKYRVVFENDQAQKHLSAIKKSGHLSDIKKVEKIIRELSETPYTGTGKPEIMKHRLSGIWSRRINKKDRIVYMVKDDIFIVYVLSAKGHYYDK